MEKNKNKIINTIINFRPNLFFHFFGNPDTIENQEAEGQKQLCNSDVLPCKCSSKDKIKLESLGIVFGDVLKDDPLFCKVLLPYDWKKENTDHSLWSNLIDSNGKKVASIFYKAASYDRRAFWRIEE